MTETEIAKLFSGIVLPEKGVERADRRDREYFKKVQRVR